MTDPPAEVITAVAAEIGAAMITRQSPAEIARRALAAAQATTLPAIDGEPLTHFFHCWRFPDHQACAVALIERQAEEYYTVLGRAHSAERNASQSVAAERERCIRLAEDHDAVITKDCICGPHRGGRFASLLQNASGSTP